MLLGPNRYGKAEIRVVRITRDADVHHIKDCDVGVALSGDMAAVHLTGDNAAVLPTDSQKNTVFAFARKHGIAEIEEFALLLARHFVDSLPSVHRARVAVEEYLWDRIPAGDGADGAGAGRTGADGTRASGTGHSFVRSGRETRTCVVHYDGPSERATVVSGLTGLTVLNSTGSEFHGFAEDEYTTLRPTRDRVLATEVRASWRHRAEHDGFGASYARARGALLAAFAGTHSLSLQQTLYAMGCRVLEECGELCEIRLSLPNRHHFTVDLEPFGLDNANEVFFAADRPYGLIEGAVLADDAPDAGFAWE
ncbi:factor-independent urate hydroxylase [Actinoallomurus rhizosphaericola]|uniref:factor-independent urate hydroxylase n=1 Tax=Actinoallomurus rhizosphaericola TaxID=2952536 RepID=UPI00209207BE|nr:urate oxidase [Actinoallomurus rhizosphaericola]MCO5995331.1 urate oxidase [Actinoallomurus rhizosphaericola]